MVDFCNVVLCRSIKLFGGCYCTVCNATMVDLGQLVVNVPARQMILNTLLSYGWVHTWAVCCFENEMDEGRIHHGVVDVVMRTQMQSLKSVCAQS